MARTRGTEEDLSNVIDGSTTAATTEQEVSSHDQTELNKLKSAMDELKTKYSGALQEAEQLRTGYSSRLQEVEQLRKTVADDKVEVSGLKARIAQLEHENHILSERIDELEEITEQALKDLSG